MGSTVSRPAPSPPKASPCSLFDVLDVRELREELLQHVPLHTLHALKASRALRAHAAEAIAARGWGVAAVDVSCGVHVKLLRALVAVGGRIALADGLYDLHQQPRKTLTLARATTLFAASAFRGGEGPGLGAGPRVRIVGPKYADALTLCARAAGLVRLEGVAVHAAAGVSGGKCVAVERPGVGDNERWLAENVVGRSYNGPIAQGTRSQPSLTLLRCELRGKVVVQEGAAARLDGCSLRGISVSEDALWCAGSLVLLRSQVDAPLPAAADELQVARRTVSGTEAGQRDCVFVGNQVHTRIHI